MIRKAFAFFDGEEPAAGYDTGGCIFEALLSDPGSGVEISTAYPFAASSSSHRLYTSASSFSAFSSRVVVEATLFPLSR